MAAGEPRGLGLRASPRVRRRASWRSHPRLQRRRHGVGERRRGRGRVARLRIDNRQQEGSSATQRVDGRQAWLPLLLHPDPHEALFLGLGTGVTARTAARHPGSPSSRPSSCPRSSKRPRRSPHGRRQPKRCAWSTPMPAATCASPVAVSTSSSQTTSIPRAAARPRCTPSTTSRPCAGDCGRAACSASGCPSISSTSRRCDPSSAPSSRHFLKAWRSSRATVSRRRGGPRGSRGRRDVLHRRRRAPRRGGAPVDVGSVRLRGRIRRAGQLHRRRSVAARSLRARRRTPTTGPWWRSARRGCSMPRIRCRATGYALLASVAPSTAVARADDADTLRRLSAYCAPATASSKRGSRSDRLPMPRRC